jgi:hypothetical protein
MSLELLFVFHQPSPRTICVCRPVIHLTMTCVAPDCLMTDPQGRL